MQPTLVVHAADDPLASYADARALAERMRHARFRTVRSGGHVFMHRDQNVVAEVREFLLGNGTPPGNAPARVPTDRRDPEATA